MKLVNIVKRTVANIDEAIATIGEVRATFIGGGYTPSFIWSAVDEFDEPANFTSVNRTLAKMKEMSANALITKRFVDVGEEFPGYAILGAGSETSDVMLMEVSLDKEEGVMTVRLIAECKRAFLEHYVLDTLHKLGFGREDFAAATVQLFVTNAPAGVRWYENKGQYVARAYQEYQTPCIRRAFELELQAEVLRAQLHHKEYNLDAMRKASALEPLDLIECDFPWVNVFINELFAVDAPQARKLLDECIEVSSSL